MGCMGRLVIGWRLGCWDILSQLGEGLSSQGAISLFRNPHLREYLLNFFKEFMYTTYPAPAGIAASIKALELIQS